jgi:hypothetical protein
MLAVYLAGIIPAIAQNAVQEQPKLESVLEELVTLGPSVHPSQTPLGERNIVPITGGTFSGPDLRGKIVPGGWDWQLSTKNGTVTLPYGKRSIGPEVGWRGGETETLFHTVVRLR